MKIRSVAVLGAGAVGAYILYGLSQTKDVDFCVVADGARKERLERDGILIDDKKAVRIFRPAVRTPQEARGADLLLVAVKYTALDSVLEDIRTIAAPHHRGARHDRPFPPQRHRLRGEDRDSY